MQIEEEEQSFSNLFIPLTTKKAIIWIIILGFIIFGNGIFNNFVGDDQQQITEDASIQSFNNIPYFFTGSTFYNGNIQNQIGAYYKPLQTTVFSLVYNLNGSNPLTFHFFQISLYIINTILLFLFLKHFFKKEVAFLLSLIFLVHPVNSEVAYYISDTQDILYFLFGILALLLLIKIKRIRNIIFVLLLLFLSVLSKETGILFICISGLYIYLFKKRYIYYAIGGFIALFALYGLLRINAVGFLNDPGDAPIDKLTFLQRFLNIPSMFSFYLQQFFIPINHSSSYMWIITSINLNNFILPLIFDSFLLIIIAFFAIKLQRNYSKKQFLTYGFFAIWFLIGIILNMQLYPLDATVAERWFYFPIVGMLGMGGVLMDVYQFKPTNKLNILIISIIAIFLFGESFFRSFDWRDNLTLYTHDIQVSQGNYALENGLGALYFNQGNISESKIYIDKSISDFPYFTNYNVLGLIYEKEHNYTKSRQAYLKALQFGDRNVTYENLASLTLAIGKPKQNIQFIKQALEKYPQDSTLWYYLAMVEYNDGEFNDAKDSIKQAYAFNQSAQITNVYNIIMSK